MFTTYPMLSTTKKFSLLIFVTLLTILLLSIVFIGKGQDSPNQGGFYFHFRNASTGYSIVPDKIQIEQLNKNNSIIDVLSNEIDKNAGVSITVPNGKYNIVVTKEGYKPMITTFTVNEKIIKANFNLVSLVPRYELSSQYIKSLNRSDAMIIVGFIVDDESGEPIQNVQVFSQDGKGKTSSDKNGFYQLILPLPENQNSISSRNVLVIQKIGYVTEIRQDFDMWENGDMILSFRLHKGTGANRESVITERKPVVMTLDNK